jgi:hypothetical protein
MPPSFGVNNPFAPKFPRIRYLLWFEVCHRISTNLRGHKYSCSGSYFSPNLACSNGSSFHATNPKLLELLLIHGVFKLCWRFWSCCCSSKGISFFSPSGIILISCFLSFLHIVVLLFLKPRFICPLQELRSHLTIVVDDKPGFTFLGPMGNPDPIEMINFETSRIPFKHASFEGPISRP